MAFDQTLSASNLLTAQLGTAVKSPVATKDTSKAAKAAQDFEAVFITEMMKPMFETNDVDDVFGGGHGEEVFRGLMTQEYGKLFAQKGGLGLSAKVQAELLKLQEHQVTDTTSTATKEIT